MAITTLRFDLTWENGNAIQLTRKEDSEDAIVIINMEENGFMGALMDSFKQVCKDTFERALDHAGNSMVS